MHVKLQAPAALRMLLQQPKRQEGHHVPSEVGGEVANAKPFMRHQRPDALLFAYAVLAALCEQAVGEGLLAMRDTPRQCEEVVRTYRRHRQAIQWIPRPLAAARKQVAQ